MSRDAPSLDALRQAAADGTPESLYRLASELVARGALDEAFGLHARAADGGHAAAAIEHARMLLYGVTAPPDPAAAVRRLQQVEAVGHAAAGYFLALIALGNVVLPRDGAVDTRLMAAVQAQYPLALRAAALLLGRRPHGEDQALCLRLLQDAAARGDAICAALLAERIARGEGVAADAAAASRLRAQLAAAGAAPLPAVTAEVPAQPPSRPKQVSALEALFVPPAQVLSERPRVAVIDGLLSADECRLLIACAQPMLRDSRTVDPETGLPVALPIRTSSDASFDPIVEDFALRCVQLRLCAAAGVELVHAEHLTVLRYAPGQEYRPHRDDVPPGAIERDRPQAGNRARTICVYLNDVEAGGDTEFPHAGVRVSPRAGRAVVFDNLLADGTPDVDSLHAGLPVLRGEKWLATLWLRQGRYRNF